MATSTRGGVSPYGQRPPGNALLATEQAATARQAAGKNPGFDPAAAVHALLHGTQSPADALKQSAALGGQKVQAPTLLTGATLGLDALRHLPSLIEGAHKQAVGLAHAKQAPSLTGDASLLLSGALGIPRMGTNFEKGEPPVPPGHVRLYRGEGAPTPPGWTGTRETGVDPMAGRWFTANKEFAKNYGPNLHYVDVPHEVARSALRPPGLGPIEYVLPKELAATSRPLLAGQTHPLLAAKPKIQKGGAPTAPTLGESVTGALTGARGLRSQQEALRSPVRAERAAANAKALQANPTAAGAKAARAELAGKYPALHFGDFEHFTPEAHDAMVKFIADHPNLRAFEPARATGALQKVRDGIVPQKNEEKLLRTIFGPDVTKQLMTSVSRFRQLKEIGYDVGNIPRSVMASYDASGLLRQALLIATSHPVVWAKNVPDYFKAIRSEEFANKALDEIHSRPNAVNGYYDKIGLDLTEMTPRGQTAAREESFRSPLAEKIPGVRASGRGYTVALDKNRADLADLLQAKAARLDGKMVSRIRVVDGKPRLVRERFDQNAQSLHDSIGSVVNSQSGRGDLGHGVIGKSQEGLNLLFFSPRLIKSRVDFINPYWYAKLDPLARHEAYRAMAGLVGLVAATDAIAHEAGASVNLDPRSSDFAKMRLGNTRIDLGGGFLQYMRLLSQLATQQVVSTTGKTTNLGQEGPGKTSDWDVVFRFIRSKLAPITSASVDAAQRQNAVGQPLTWQNTALARLTPLSGQDAVSVGRDASSHGLPAGIAAGIAAFGLSAVGGGVQNFTPKAAKGSAGGYGKRSGGGGSAYGQRGSSGSAYGRRP